jgi:ankyrin repeat protein/catechol 2,3-dioxygenase-like lactoylglutathione lyase family enzyme
MPDAQLPERPSLEYLKKLAKDRLHEMRGSEPQAKLASALLAVARDHGFASWRALKAEVERRQAGTAAHFFEACAAGSADTVHTLLRRDPDLARIADPNAPYGGWTGLHTAAQKGHADVARLLLDHGADPNAREAGDNTTPLHWAAAGARLEIVRMLLDSGGDVHGIGDLHELDTIGWGTVYHGDGEDTSRLVEPRRSVIALLVERGARHHIFSAIASGDLDLIRTLVEQSPEALDRRMSRFENKQTPLHFAMSRGRYDILELLIDLGADLEAEDQRGQTALAVATLRADAAAISRLRAAGAKAPEPVAAEPELPAKLAELAASVRKIVPTMRVADIARTFAWYTSIGFEEMGRYADQRGLVWGMLRFGNAQLALDTGGKPGPHDVSFWFETDRIERLYQLLRSMGDIPFEEDLYEPFYGGRQFSIRDPDGYVLVFLQPED